MDNNGVVQVALKKRLRFKSNIYLEPVRPDKVKEVLTYLKPSNFLYSNIEIDIDQRPDELIYFKADIERSDSYSESDASIDFVCDEKNRGYSKL